MERYQSAYKVYDERSSKYGNEFNQRVHNYVVKGDEDEDAYNRVKKELGPSPKVPEYQDFYDNAVQKYDDYYSLEN